MSKDKADSMTSIEFDDYITINGSNIDELIQHCSQISKGNCYVFDSTTTSISTLIKTWSLEYMERNLPRLRYVIVNMSNIPDVSSKCWHSLAGWTPMLHTKIILFSQCFDIDEFPYFLKRYCREVMTMEEWIARELLRSKND
jgi:hypothetical protein